MGDWFKVWQDTPHDTNVGHWLVGLRCSGLSR